MSIMDKERIKKLIKEYLPYILILIGVILIKRFIISPIRVKGQSMMNTLHNGDIMILNIVGYRFEDIKRFDIVVIKEDNEYLIKRVIGLPGEIIEYKDNELYVNGEKIKENYGKGNTEDFTVKVKKNSYFVLGDNRENSMDSRVFGSFPEKEILGKTSLTIFPFNRLGTKK